MACHFLYLFSCLQWLHLENCFYFVGAGHDALSGYQTAQYIASCYAKNTLLQIELELGFAHIGESFCEVRNIRSIFLACYYDVINVREYISIDLVH
jgi:hypothetical protein